MNWPAAAAGMLLAGSLISRAGGVNDYVSRPYVESFESYSNGYGLIPNVTGWSGDTNATTAVVTNTGSGNFYAYDFANAPLGAGVTHSNVLYVNGLLVNNLAGRASAIVHVDYMGRFVYMDNTNAAVADPLDQGALYVNANKHLVVNSADGWAEMSATSIDSNDWVRVTLLIDHAHRDAGNNSFFQVYVNNILLTHPLGYNQNTGTPVHPGSWLKCGNAAKTDVTQFIIAGQGFVDDLRVAASAPRPLGALLMVTGGTAGSGGSGTNVPGNPAAGTIPDDRLADWRPRLSVGVPGGIPTNRTHLIDVTLPPYNADKTGAANAQPAIMQAITAAASNDVVYLPAGTYRCDATIYVGMKSWITIRGAGPQQTIVRPQGNSSGFSIGVGADWWYPNRLRLPITASAARGATVLEVGDTTPLNAYPYNGGIGQPCQLASSNDAAIPVLAPAHYEYQRRQVSRIVAQTPTTVTIAPPLLFDLPRSLGPRLAPVGYLSQFVGIEDLSVNGTNSTSAVQIGMSGVYGCWVSNVTVSNTPNYEISISDALQCEIRHCRLAVRMGSGSNGAGVLVGTCSFCLFEDNIIVKQFPHFEVNASSGNVFGYNFCYDSTIYGVMGSSINCNHGGHNSFNLYEGNVAPNIQCDGYHGSASHDTVYRNWFHGNSPGGAGHWTLCLNRFTRKYALIGNILGDPALGTGSYSFGNPNMGNGDHTGTAQPSVGDWWADWPAMLSSPQGQGPGPSGFQELDLDVEATTYLKGNFNYTIGGVPANEALNGTVLPPSAYLTNKPAWFGNLNWPPFGPDASVTNPIPAQVRF